MKQINKGIEQFSKLKNGTLEITGSMKAEKNAVKSMNNEFADNTSLTTFVLNQKGYNYIQETNSLNEKTGEIQSSAVKQINGTLFFAQPVDSLTKERKEPYEWQDTSETRGTSYNPNGALKMMAVSEKLLSNEKYIEAITKEKSGAFLKYTLTTNDAYKKYLKEDTHSAKENFIIHEHREIYWVNEDGLLIKRQSYGEFEWTIDGIADTYISDLTLELSGYNYKKLTEIGDELPPMIMFEGELYTQASALLDVNLDALTKIGTIESVAGSVQEPEKNNQANRFIKNATVYRCGKNSVIVKYNDYMLYEKNQTN